MYNITNVLSDTYIYDFTNSDNLSYQINSLPSVLSSAAPTDMIHGKQFRNNSINNATFCLVQLVQVYSIWFKGILRSLYIYLDQVLANKILFRKYCAHQVCTEVPVQTRRNRQQSLWDIWQNWDIWDFKEIWNI